MTRIANNETEKKLKNLVNDIITEIFYTDGLYQCPYNEATRCAMDEPCRGCETWAKKEKLNEQD